MLNICFRWGLPGAVYSLFLIYVAGMLTFKQSCMEQTKEFLLKRGFRKGGRCGDKWFAWQAVSLIAVAEV